MSLAELQKQFGAHLRDPDNNPPPNQLDDRRLGAYRDLVYNNVESLLENNFPVINSILSSEIWHGLVREFLRDYRSMTPYFTCLGKEFIDFLTTRETNTDCPDFMLELAHYENLEFDIMLMDEAYPLGACPVTISEKSDLTLATTAIPLAYRYPVQTIRQDFQPEYEPEQPTYLLMFQDTEGDVRFFELHGLSYHLLQILKENKDQTLDVILLDMLAIVKQNDPNFAMSDKDFIGSGLEMLKQFHQLSVLRDSRLLGDKIC